MENQFAPDGELAEAAVELAGAAVELARDNFGKSLDRSEASIAVVEQILQLLHESLPQAKPDPSKIAFFARTFGSYVGEVFRQHHGGEWGVIGSGDDEMPGMRDKHQTLFSPWSRAYKRITNGPEDSLEHYYEHIRRAQAKA